MVKGADGKWRTMANEGLYERQKLIGMLYRNELARGMSGLGYGIEKTHADGRFELSGVSRDVVEAFSTRRAEIEAAMVERNLGKPADNPRLAERAALMTRAAKRDVDRSELQGVWRKQAHDLGFDAKTLVAEAKSKTAVRALQGTERITEQSTPNDALTASDKDAAIEDGAIREERPTADAVAWAMEARHPHLTTQKSFYVEISRARDRAELVTDDVAQLREQLQACTGERIAALEGIGEVQREAPGGGAGKSREKGKTTGAEGVTETVRERGGAASTPKERELPALERGKGAAMDLEL